MSDVATPDQNNEKFPQSLVEPQFDLPLSGWYWQVTRLDAPVPDVRSSRSLWDGTLPQLAELAASVGAGVTHSGYAEGPEGQQLRVLERTIDLGEEGRYLVAVAGDANEIDEEVRSFDVALLVTFGVMGIVLLLITTFQVASAWRRSSGSPRGCRRSAPAGPSDWKAVFPVEIAPLARETNALIEANREIVMRARTHAGNLAHALKTPLSVMMNEATAHSGDPFALKVREQTEIMRDQVARHLERARLAARVAVVGTVIEVRPVVAALARTMEKIHHRRGLAIDIDAGEGARFRGEQQDLEEMVGNLVDNACKWAQSRVAIEVFSEKPDAGRRSPRGAHRGRRRRTGAVAAAARTGDAAGPPPRRDQAGLRARAFDRGRACRPLWRQAHARHRADRRPAGGTGAAGGVSAQSKLLIPRGLQIVARPFGCRARVLP